jgi:hypothetical protein
LYRGFRGCLILRGEAVTACVLQAQATPPDCFARWQRVGDEINARDVLLVRHQSFVEFPWSYPVTE